MKLNISDRFDRKVKNGKENLSKPINPLKVSVPEASGEWLLGVSAIALLSFLSSFNQK
ncbi:hypothetical protein [Nostoc sp. DSM 114167]|uniref:hypothetical protein n=1 Tax=Nostoc sp. DSM 114167 TaxID=3439050 RepID=UPI0040456F29